MPLKISIEEVKRRLFEKHGDEVKIIEVSYRSYHKSADFYDKDFGIFTNLVHKVCSSGQGHPSKKIIKAKNTLLKKYGFDSPFKVPEFQRKIKQTNLERYGVENPFQSLIIQEQIKKHYNKTLGVDYPSQNKNIRLKAAKSANKTRTVIYWETGDVLCLEGWEDLTAEYWNRQKVRYISQPKSFDLGELKTYTPDFYLPDQDLWVEVKGRWYDEQSKSKWEKFHQLYINSELWNKDKLKQLEIKIPKKR